MAKLKQILIIEPDSVLGAVLSSAITAAGHQPTLVANAQEAITLADKNTPDLIILELQLVSHSGIEFLYEFRSYPEWETVPAIIYSGVPPTEFTNSHENLSEELKVTKYLYKPNTTLADLIRIVNQLLTQDTVAAVGLSADAAA